VKTKRPKTPSNVRVIMRVSPKKLNKMTEHALSQLEEQALRQVVAQEEQLERITRRDQERAAKAMKSIERRARESAKRGNHFCEVYKLKDEDLKYW